MASGREFLARARFADDQKVAVGRREFRQLGASLHYRAGSPGAPVSAESLGRRKVAGGPQAEIDRCGKFIELRLFEEVRYTCPHGGNRHFFGTVLYEEKQRHVRILLMQEASEFHGAGRALANVTDDRQRRCRLSQRFNGGVSVACSTRSMAAMTQGRPKLRYDGLVPFDDQDRTDRFWRVVTHRYSDSVAGAAIRYRFCARKAEDSL